MTSTSTPKRKNEFDDPIPTEARMAKKLATDRAHSQHAHRTEMLLRNYAITRALWQHLPLDMIAEVKKRVNMWGWMLPKTLFKDGE